jgi:uncharacterized protein YlzI (FlbEa/FlbD family)
MNKFLKLTEVYSNGSTIPIILNVDNILAIKKSDKTPDTHITMKDAKYFFVKETTDNIWLKINGERP